MKNLESVLFLIQARDGSTRVQHKMSRSFAGSTLLDVCISKVSSMLSSFSTSVTRDLNENFYLSVAENEFVGVAKKHGIKEFHRSERSVQEPVYLQTVFEWHDKLPFEYYVLFNACNPLMSIDTMTKFVERFVATDSRGLFGVLEKKTFFYGEDGRMLNRFFGEDKHLVTLETKFVEAIYEAAHSLYAGKISDIKDDVYMGSFNGTKNDPEFFVMPENECFDIDWPWQFEMAEILFNHQKNGG